MRILIVGGGGREHALAWKLSKEADVHVAPGNVGTARCATNHDVKPTDRQGIAKLADRLQPDFVLFGPENPLIEGLGDLLRSRGHHVFGPNEDAAQLEGSKAFAKSLMADAEVPTAASQTFADYDEAIEYAKKAFGRGQQLAVKASGLALGKGVIVADTLEIASDAIHRLIVERELGEAGGTLVLEERLYGREFSLLTLCCEQGILSLPVAQDHKTLLDFGQGPNTGGMGTYAPVPWVTPDIIERTEREVVQPVLHLLSQRGLPYRGVLFSGLMLTEHGPKCLEYNVRFGDPETQSVVPLLGPGFADCLLAVSQGEAIPTIEVADRSVVSVVLASQNYPYGSSEEQPIFLDNKPLGGSNLSDSLFELEMGGTFLFVSGVAQPHDPWLASGGRVLAVSSSGATLAEARERTYGAIERIQFEGMQFRSDIGASAV